MEFSEPGVYERVHLVSTAVGGREGSSDEAAGEVKVQCRLSKSPRQASELDGALKGWSKMARPSSTCGTQLLNVGCLGRGTLGEC